MNNGSGNKNGRKNPAIHIPFKRVTELLFSPCRQTAYLETTKTIMLIQLKTENKIMTHHLSGNKIIDSSSAGAANIRK